jgi:hypothetical protein
VTEIKLFTLNGDEGELTNNVKTICIIVVMKSSGIMMDQVKVSNMETLRGNKYDRDRGAKRL